MEEWLDLDERGRVIQIATQQGGMLVFRDQMFTWEELDAAAGRYVIGFMVQDLDGNEEQTYTQVTVQ